MKKNDYVQHRAWRWFGTVVSFPDPLYPLSSIQVRREDTQKTEEHWLPSLITDPDHFVYDWGDINETFKERKKSKNRKPRH